MTERVARRHGLLFVVSAPSGTGKTTLCRAMTRVFPGLHYSVSFTTRPPRPGDQDGQDYHFVTTAEFQRMIEAGEFLEWAEIYGHRYGTSGVLIENIRAEGRDVILDIDEQGARQLRDKNLSGIFILILPPNLAELHRRLAGRKTENGSALAQRLEKAKSEMAEARWYDYIVVNDAIKKAEERLGAIIVAEHCRRERMMGFLENLLEEPITEG
jgi:guanylate kinase